MPRKPKRAEVQRRPDTTDKLVIFYAMWGEPIEGSNEDPGAQVELVAMGRSEDEFTRNLAWWMLGVTEDQEKFEVVLSHMPSARWPLIKQFVEDHSEGSLTRDAYTLGVDG